MDEADLTDIERLVWDAFPTGRWINLRPGQEVRAEVLRALLLGARPAVDGEQAALRLGGAVITGRLVLSHADIGGSISLRNCHFTDAPDIYGARMRRLRLVDCELPGLNLAVTEISAGIRLSGTIFTGQLSLAGARIGGAIVLDGSKVSGAGRAFDGTQLTASRNILAREGFECHGELCLDGAEVVGSLRLTGAVLDNPGGWALNGAGLRVGAVLDLSGGTTVTGSMRLSNVVVGSLLTLSRLTLTEPGHRAVDLRSLEAPELMLQTAVPIPGRVDLGYARIGLLRDSPETWPHSLTLGGFTYDVIAGAAPVEERLRWLRRDPSQFRPQVYGRLAAIYMNGGRDDDARAVRLAGERRRRESLPRTRRLWGWLQDVTVGYGYRPRRAAAWLLGLLVLGWVVFGVVPPRAAEAPKAPEFHALAYAADLLLPVVDLGQQPAYLPRGWTAWIGYLLIGAGLLFATTAAAGVARRLRRD
ncbi:hypothetical protein [Actinoplanes sp. NPDC051851]|uniref:hypothetical protein n=1 Tax=Actinoplanes sp. NPDC051851 TaxID=3154753 RepID=UPI0034453D79